MRRARTVKECLYRPGHVLSQLLNDRDDLPREVAVDVLKHLVNAIVALVLQDRASMSTA